MTDGGRGRLRTAVSVTATGLAGLLVLVALAGPDDIMTLTPAAFVRLPIEALVGTALLLVLPARARTIVAVCAGLALGALAVVKMLDIGFLAALSRPFDVVLDWDVFDDAFGLVASTAGPAAAIGAAAGAVLLAAAVLALTTLSVLRASRLAARHRTGTSRALAVGTAVWIALAVAGAELVPDVPIASADASGIVYQRAQLASDVLADRQEFTDLIAADDFRDTPPDELLTSLRGKDVVFVFVESYGRSALDDPGLAQRVGPVLDDADRRLGAAGFASRSGFLTSPVAGGGSWLAHATFLSGLWVHNDQRHDRLVTSDRLTLSRAFRSAGWETVAVMPGTTQAWPEADFFGYDRVHDAHGLGYHGPAFSLATMPDQFTLAAFERLEHSRQDRGPLMAEIPLMSSHAPWWPYPRLLGWDELGDGSVFAPQSTVSLLPSDIWFRDPELVRAGYAGSIAYSLESLVSYVETYGDDDLVVVMLGDHKPAPVVTGSSSDRDVPISILTRDHTVLDRIGGWGWQDGLRPGPAAPVWPMDAFRDRFLSAFGPGTVPPGLPH